MGQAFLSLPLSPHQSETADLKSEVETWLRTWPRRKTILLIALNIFNFSLSYQLSVTSKGHIDLFHGYIFTITIHFCNKPKNNLSCLHKQYFNPI